jgi:hypothetical protein
VTSLVLLDLALHSFYTSPKGFNAFMYLAIISAVPDHFAAVSWAIRKPNTSSLTAIIDRLQNILWEAISNTYKTTIS